MISNMSLWSSHCFSTTLHPPVLQISSSAPTIRLLVNSQFKLQCVPESNLLSPEISWSFTPQLNEDLTLNVHSSALSHTGQELELNPVEHRHAGNYTCVVRGSSEDGIMKMKRTFKISVIGETKRGSNVNVPSDLLFEESVTRHGAWSHLRNIPQESPGNVTCTAFSDQSQSRTQQHHDITVFLLNSWLTFKMLNVENFWIKPLKSDYI